MHSYVDAETRSRLDPEGAVAVGLTRALTAYVDVSTLRGGRVLDFGCGIGSSSLHLARLLPETEIIGVDLNPTLVAGGNDLRTEAGFRNLSFQVSPAGDQVPPFTTPFDVIVLCAVYEHLRPLERKHLLPRLWRHLKPGGIMLITGTPYRWFPIEYHTTGLPLLNYLPNRLTWRLAQRFGKFPHQGAWPDYLRAGIRGGTEWSVLREIGAGRIVQPRESDRATYWLTGTSQSYRGVKRLIAEGFRLTDRWLGTVPSTHLDIAIRKD